MPEDCGAGEKQNSSHGEAGKRFVATVTIWMFGVGRLACEPKAGVNNGGGKNVAGGFKAVRQDSGGSGLDSNKDLGQGEYDSDTNAEQRESTAEDFFACNGDA